MHKHMYNYICCKYELQLQMSHLTLRGRHQAVLPRFCVAADSCDEVSVLESLQGRRNCLTCCVMCLSVMLVLIGIPSHKP